MEETKEIQAAEEVQAKKPKKKLKDRIKGSGGKAMGDFKKFAFKGNIIDLAIAVIIGAAFGKIISSLVGDVIMPCIGALIGDINFSDLKILFSKGVYDEATGEVIKPENAIFYGKFIQTIFEFFIIAISIFIVYKVVMKLKAIAEHKKAQEVVPPPVPTVTEQLLTDIKGLLTEQNKAKEVGNKKADG